MTYAPYLPGKEDWRLVEWYSEWGDDHQLKQQAQQEGHQSNQHAGYQQRLHGLVKRTAKHTLILVLISFVLNVETK